MLKGFLLNRVKRYRVTPDQPCWIPGEPEWTSSGLFNPKETVQHPVIAYRCKDCGYLEIFAPKRGSGGPRVPKICPKCKFSNKADSNIYSNCESVV